MVVPPSTSPRTRPSAAFTAIVKVTREKFGLAKLVMVGDRGMITSARIAALNQPGDLTFIKLAFSLRGRAARRIWCGAAGGWLAGSLPRRGAAGGLG